jgi:hypothetical protein
MAGAGQWEEVVVKCQVVIHFQYPEALVFECYWHHLIFASRADGVQS